MDPLKPESLRRATVRLLVVALLTASASGCANDSPTPAEPLVGGISAMAKQNTASGNAIVVTSSAELVAALVPERRPPDPGPCRLL